MARFRLYQTTFASQLPLLAPETEGEVDVEILVQPVAPPSRQDGLGWEASRGVLRLELAGIARYAVDRRGIRVEPLGEGAALHLRHTPLAALLALRGLVPLHAAAVLAREGAVLLFARPGGGKSTLAAALTQRGYPLLCDELAMVRGDAVVPSLPEHRLWEDARRALRLPRGCPLAGTDKQSLPAPSWVEQARRVAAMVFVTYTNEPAVELRAADPGDLEGALAALTYRRRMLQGLGCAPAWATTVPAYQLTRPRDLSRLDEGADLVASRMLPGRPEGGPGEPAR